MTDKVEVKLRVPQEIKNKLQKQAENEKRSLNNLLEIIIDEYLSRLSQENKTHETPSRPHKY